MSLEQRFGLIKTFFNQNSFQALECLSEAEKLFIYYFYRASLAGYLVTLQQFCRFPNKLWAIGETLFNHELSTEKRKHLTDWWVFLFSNYGVYLLTENVNNKQTPATLNLDLSADDFKHIAWTEASLDYFFNVQSRPTFTVPSDIEASGGNFYDSNLTNQDYSQIDDQTDALVSSWGLDDRKIYKFAYNTSNIPALAKVVFWLKKALAHAQNQPSYFDQASIEYLKLLIKSFITGDEKDFKESQKHWTQINNRVQFSMGFIEHYDDPMTQIGTFQADIVLKVGNLDSLVALLPSFEEGFNFPRQWKRTNMSSLPNASFYHKIFAIGGLGPLAQTLAYCLPNYEDLRSICGSKQVIYLGAKPSDPNRYSQLYLNQVTRQKTRQFSNDLALIKDLSDLLTVLHETIGHASGALHGVTQKTKERLVGKWGTALEELRAEIIALYCALKYYDRLVDAGAFKDWHKLLSNHELKTLLVLDLMNAGWSRWIGLAEHSTNVTQAHAIADTAILYYILDHCENFRLVQKTIDFEGKQLAILSVEGFYDQQVFEVVEKMAHEVQSMASEPEPRKIEQFMLKYGASTRNIDYAKIVRTMHYHYRQGVKASLEIFPEWHLDHNGCVVVNKPNSAFEALKNLWTTIFLDKL